MRTWRARTCGSGEATSCGATVIAAPFSPKNAQGERDPEMNQTKTGNQRYFGMKADIAVDAHSGPVHTITTRAVNEAEVEQIAELLHGKEKNMCGPTQATETHMRGLTATICNRTSLLAPATSQSLKGAIKAAARKREHRNASVLAKVEHPFRVIKRQLGPARVSLRSWPGTPRTW